jgi:Xaa-Pro aminopeptidase
MFGLTAHRFAPVDLDRFRAAQRLSFAALEAVAATLREGETEKEVARRIHRALKDGGAQNYFHVPVALFGDRTAYPGDFGPLGALPTPRRLRSGDAVILDAAPIFDGYTVDTSLTLRFGDGGVPQALDRALAELRRGILQHVRQRQLAMREIAKWVEAQLRAWDLENCHRKHIGQVLGHRVTREDHAWLRRRKVWGLAPRQVGWFFLQSFRSARGEPALSPNWNHARQSDCLPPDGLWAIEPHVASGGFGAKFEDLLLIQDGQASYLDDDLPHTRRWRAAGIA